MTGPGVSVITVHDDDGTRIVVGCADMALRLYNLLKPITSHSVTLEHGLPTPDRTDAEKVRAVTYVKGISQG